MKKVQKFCAVLPDMDLKATDIPEENPNIVITKTKGRYPKYLTKKRIS